ncbi:MAG: hypothetical protein WCP73_09200, partial [Eubacteriales bacterium]
MRSVSFWRYSARSGDYTFSVKSCNEDGCWSPEQAKLALRIIPAFYQAWWFWITFFLLGSVCFAFLCYLFTIRKRRVL